MVRKFDHKKGRFLSTLYNKKSDPRKKGEDDRQADSKIEKMFPISPLFYPEREETRKKKET